MRLIQPQPLPSRVSFRPIVYLGGPVYNAEDWQSRAAAYIEGVDPRIVVVSPRAEAPLAHGDWPWIMLQQAMSRGSVLFWLCSPQDVGPFGVTTRQELAWVAGSMSARPHSSLFVGTDGGYPELERDLAPLKLVAPGLSMHRSLSVLCAVAAESACRRVGWDIGSRRRRTSTAIDPRLVPEAPTGPVEPPEPTEPAEPTEATDPQE